MGCCCDGSRTSPTGIEKSTKGRTDSGVKFKSMDPIRNTIIKVLREGRHT